MVEATDQPMQPEPPAKPEPPLRMYPGRLDDRGRVKLPVDFQEYFSALGEKRFFVTSLNRRTAQVYTIPAWRENAKFLASYREDPKVAERVAFNAADLGAEAELDKEGRILFSVELRRELGIENQPVRLYAYRNRIEVLSDKIYQERKGDASVDPVGDLAKLEAAGLN
jgi:DNA-binding transcriptional regulator/RsmH inhibitor MraZ